MENYLAKHKPFLYEMKKYKSMIDSVKNLKEEEK